MKPLTEMTADEFLEWGPKSISAYKEGVSAMDKASSDVYKKMGFTHFVPIRSADPRQPDGYKAVKASERSGFFVDENGVEYAQSKVDGEDNIKSLDSEPAPAARTRPGH